MYNLTLPEKYSNESSRDYVYRTIKDNILTLNLTPGQNLSEPDVAKSLSVSRTPVREAFIRLAADKLLDVMPQKGTQVTLLDIELINEAIFVRSNLETAVLRNACEYFPDEILQDLHFNLQMQESIIANNYQAQRFHKLDSTFHALIFQGCNHKQAWEFIDRFHTHHHRLRMFEAVDAMYLNEILKQHQEIYRIIAEKDATAIADTIYKHLTNFLPNLESLKKKHRKYFS